MKYFGFFVILRKKVFNRIYRREFGSGGISRIVIREHIDVFKLWPVAVLPVSGTIQIFIVAA